MFNEAIESRELAATSVACLLTRMLMELSLVNSQCQRTAKHLATLVTAVFNGLKMNCRDVIIHLCLISECL